MRCGNVWKSYFISTWLLKCAYWCALCCYVSSVFFYWKILPWNTCEKSEACPQVSAAYGCGLSYLMGLICIQGTWRVFCSQHRFLLCNADSKSVLEKIQYINGECITRGFMCICVGICMEMMPCEHPLTIRPCQTLVLFRYLLKNCPLRKAAVSRGVT